MFGPKKKRRTPKNGFTDESLNKETPKGEIVFKISFFISVIAILFFGGKALIGYTKSEIKKNENVETNLVVVPDVIGLDIDNAKEFLSALKINTQIQYSDNEFFDIDAVIKMSLDPGTQIEKGSTIILYVAKKDNIKKVEAGKHYFDNIFTEKLPVRKNEIIVKNIYIKDNYAIFVLNNDSEKALHSMKFTVGYIDENGEKFLNKPSLHIGLQVEPFRDFKIKQVLKNPKIKGITIEKIDTIKQETVDKVKQESGKE